MVHAIIKVLVRRIQSLDLLNTIANEGRLTFVRLEFCCHTFHSKCAKANEVVIVVAGGAPRVLGDEPTLHVGHLMALLLRNGVNPLNHAVNEWPQVLLLSDFRSAPRTEFGLKVCLLLLTKFALLNHMRRKSLTTQSVKGLGTYVTAVGIIRA